MENEKIPDHMRDYMRPHLKGQGSITRILARAVGSDREILKDPERLMAALEEKGATEVQKTQVRMVTQVPGYQELFVPEGHVKRAQMDRFVRNAIEVTGLTRTAVLSIMEGIALSAHIALRYSGMGNSAKYGENEDAWVVPARIYTAEMDELKDGYDESVAEAGAEKLDRLKRMADAGDAEAACMLGSIYLNSKNGGDEIALEYLNRALDQGSAKAALLLGDYYYKQNSADALEKAYACYTEWGAPALNGSQRSHVETILRHKQYNLRMIVAGCVLLCLILLTVVAASATPTFAACGTLGILCVLVNAVLVLGAVWRFKKSPYGGFYRLPMAQFLIWAVYMMARMVF